MGGFSTGVSVKSSQNAEGSTDSSSQSGNTNLPTIVYTSRTHSQIRQVIKELKRTSYRLVMGGPCSLLLDIKSLNLMLVFHVSLDI